MLRLAIATLVLLISATLATAADVDFSVVLKDPSGIEYKDCVRADDATNRCLEMVPLTLGRIASRALDMRFDDERNLASSEVVKRGNLVARLASASTAVINTSENDLIRRLIAKLPVNNFLIRQAWVALDPASIDNPQAAAK